MTFERLHIDVCFVSGSGIYTLTNFELFLQIMLTNANASGIPDKGWQPHFVTLETT